MPGRSVRRSSPREISRKAGGHVPLDRDRVLAAALRLMDANGLDALTMRKLASELDVEAMSLYYHVPGKAALLEGLAETVLAEVQLPSGDARDWPEASRAVARALRDNARAHPHAMPLLASLGLGSSAARRHTEDVLGVLGAAGLAPHAAFTAFLVIRSYVLGYVLWEIRHAEAKAAGTIAATEPELLMTAPHLATLATFIATFDNDAEFERGLEVIVTGLGSVVHTRGGALT
jgi:AcrR family transcriptional regulator